MTIATGNSDRVANMRAFAEVLIDLLAGAVEAIPPRIEERDGVEGQRWTSQERG